MKKKMILAAFALATLTLTPGAQAQSQLTFPAITPELTQAADAGYKSTLIDELEARDMLHPVKSGTARNARWKYSLTELQCAITAIEAGALINK